MTKSPGEIHIKVSIGDRVYPLTIDVKQEETVRKASKMLNEKIKFYGSSFSVKDSTDSLAFAALEYAVDALSKDHIIAKPTRDTEWLDKELEGIESLLHRKRD